jgi:hypothetical protein
VQFQLAVDPPFPRSNSTPVDLILQKVSAVELFRGGWPEFFKKFDGVWSVASIVVVGECEDLAEFLV